MRFCFATALFCVSMALLTASTLPAHGGFLLVWLAVLVNLVVVAATPHISDWTIPEVITIILSFIGQMVFICALNEVAWSDGACVCIALIEVAVFLASATQMQLRDF